MLTPCEVAVKCVVPVIRAMVAKELIQEYGLKQEEAGGLLGITQAAISHYLRRVRGTALDLEGDAKICKSVKETAAKLIAKDLSTQEARSKICSLCGAIRRRGLMCTLHSRFEPGLETRECGVCLT